MATLLSVPYLGSAEEEVRLSQWLVEEGQEFRKGESLAIVETLKAAFEIEAEARGTLVRKLVAERTRLPVMAAIAVLGAPGEVLSAVDIERLAATAAAATPEPVAIDDAPPPVLAPAAAGVAAAPAARRRAKELGIALEGVTGSGAGGLIRVEDVERAVGEFAGDGRLEPAFVAQLRRDAPAFGRLASAFKIDLYRRAGAQIGDDVELGAETVLCADRLILGDGTRFAAQCRVDAGEFVSGRLVQFGPRCTARARRITLGDNAFLAADVEIGGGGAMDPEAELVIGSHGFIGEHTHLNPCRRLELGDEVVVSRGAVIMTHSFGGSVLAGYPNRFAPVRVGDRCQIGIGSVLFPGVEMGEGSILLSGSSLVTSVPPGRLFGGVPARDLKAATRPLSADEREQVARDLIVEFARQLQLRGRDVATQTQARTVAVTVGAAGGQHCLRFAPEPRFTAAELRAEEVVVCPTIGDDVWDTVPSEVVAVDLTGMRIRGPAGPLADAFREFLRKHGVRLQPRTWTYRGGWL